MRNATCVGIQTSKVPTRVSLLFIFYSVPLLSFSSKKEFLKQTDVIKTNKDVYQCKQDKIRDLAFTFVQTDIHSIEAITIGN